jgi:hypothetical protein
METVEEDGQEEHPEMDFFAAAYVKEKTPCYSKVIDNTWKFRLFGWVQRAVDDAERMWPAKGFLILTSRKSSQARPAAIQIPLLSFRPVNEGKRSRLRKRMATARSIRYWLKSEHTEKMDKAEINHVPKLPELHRCIGSSCRNNTMPYVKVDEEYSLIMSKFQRGVEQLLKALYSMRNSIIPSCASGETVRGLPVLQVDAGVTVPKPSNLQVNLFIYSR